MARTDRRPMHYTSHMVALTSPYPVELPSRSEEQRILLYNVPWSTYVVLRDSIDSRRWWSNSERPDGDTGRDETADAGAGTGAGGGGSDCGIALISFSCSSCIFCKTSDCSLARCSCSACCFSPCALSASNLLPNGMSV